jgi:hypothetical protein
MRYPQGERYILRGFPGLTAQVHKMGGNSVVRALFCRHSWHPPCLTYIRL